MERCCFSVGVPRLLADATQAPPALALHRTRCYVPVTAQTQPGSDYQSPPPPRSIVSTVPPAPAHPIRRAMEAQAVRGTRFLGQS